MNLNTITVPLHRVYPHSSLITGPVVVGVRPTLPVTGISFILGNDLAGGKVKPDFWVIMVKRYWLPSLVFGSGPTQSS